MYSGRAGCKEGVGWGAGWLPRAADQSGGSRWRSPCKLGSARPPGQPAC
jgi:hypothetical protein